MSKMIRVSGIEVDVVKWVIRVLIGIISFFLVHLYMQMDDMDKRLDRHSERISKIEGRVGIEKSEKK